MPHQPIPTLGIRLGAGQMAPERPEGQGSSSPYSFAFEFEQPGKPTTSYLLCAVPRAGSNLMCELLSGTGVAGAPTEMFNGLFMPVLKQHWQVETTQEYLEKLLAVKTGPNGVFGAKIGRSNYEAVFGEGDPREVLPALRMIYMARRDHVRQAVSWVRAVQSRRWQSIHGGRPDQAVEFDAAHIARKLRRIRRAEAAWRTLFDRHGIEPHEIVYEDLVAAPERVLRETLEFIGVDPPPDLRMAPTIGRLADAVTDEWVERYRSEHGDS